MPNSSPATRDLNWVLCAATSRPTAGPGRAGKRWSDEPLFNKTSGEVLGAHIYGLHAADLIQEVANAVARRQSVRQLATGATHPTLSEVVEVAYKQAAHALAA